MKTISIQHGCSKARSRKEIRQSDVMCYLERDTWLAHGEIFKIFPRKPWIKFQGDDWKIVANLWANEAFKCENIVPTALLFFNNGESNKWIKIPSNRFLRLWSISATSHKLWTFRACFFFFINLVSGGHRPHSSLGICLLLLAFIRSNARGARTLSTRQCRAWSSCCCSCSLKV